MQTLNLKRDFKIIQCLTLVFGYLYLGNALYSQGIQGKDVVSKGNSLLISQNQPVEETTDTANDNVQPGPSGETAEQTTDADTTNPKNETKPETQPMPVYTNPAMQGRVNDQYRWTPEDPSFLYETRNIPDHKNKQEFLPTELEKVEVKEQIRGEADFRKSLDKIKIRLPDLTQTLILVSIIIVILVYRSRVRRQHGTRK